jgi:hypothetical protein
MPKGDKNGQLSVKLDRKDYQRIAETADKLERTIAQQLRIIIRHFYMGAA